MPCSLYNNNGCVCAGCRNFTKSTSIAVSETNLQITIPNQTITNGQKLCIALCQSIPNNIAQGMIAQIVIDGKNFNLATPCGNYVYADQIKCRTVLHVTMATDTSLAVVSRNTKLCCTSTGFPIVTVPTTEAVTSPSV